MCTPEGRASLLRGQPTPEMALADAIRVLKASLAALGGGGDQVRGGASRSSHMPLPLPRMMFSRPGYPEGPSPLRPGTPLPSLPPPATSIQTWGHWQARHCGRLTTLLLHPPPCPQFSSPTGGSASAAAYSAGGGGGGFDLQDMVSRFLMQMQRGTPPSEGEGGGGEGGIRGEKGGKRWEWSVIHPSV